MGVDFAAILSHTMTATDVDDLSKILSRVSAPSLATAIDTLTAILKPIYVNLESDTDWHLNLHYQQDIPTPEQCWAAGDLINFEGPAGMGLWVGSHTAIAWNITRWATFLTEQMVQQALRRRTSASNFLP